MKKIFFSLFIFGSIAAFAQATKPSQDAGLWATINLEKKLNEKFSVFLTEEFRARENFSVINLFYTDIGVEYRPAKVLRLALSYRNIQKNLPEENRYAFRHRLQFDIILKKKFGNFNLAYRHRLQREMRDVYVTEKGFLPEWYSRSKFTVKYDFDKAIVPYVAAEFRYQIEDPRRLESNGTWHRARFIGGFDYKLNDKNTLGAYYLVQQEFNVKTPQSIYIVGLEYSYVF
jgi:hypothetical protein